MTRSTRFHSQQLALSLAPLPEHPCISATEEPTLLQALADLLLAALGPSVPEQVIVAVSTGSADDPENHA